MEEFKRPDHPDFMTSNELYVASFTGIRHNSLSGYMEIWVEGIKKGELPAYQYESEEWNKLYAEIFGLYMVETLPTKGN